MLWHQNGLSSPQQILVQVLLINWLSSLAWQISDPFTFFQVNMVLMGSTHTHITRRQRSRGSTPSQVILSFHDLIFMLFICFYFILCYFISYYIYFNFIGFVLLFIFSFLYVYCTYIIRIFCLWDIKKELHAHTHGCTPSQVIPSFLFICF